MDLNISKVFFILLALSLVVGCSAVATSTVDLNITAEIEKWKAEIPVHTSTVNSHADTDVLGANGVAAHTAVSSAAEFGVSSQSGDSEESSDRSTNVRLTLQKHNDRNFLVSDAAVSAIKPGSILVSPPGGPDNLFHQAVLLLLAHGNGSMGVMLNKELDEDIVDDMKASFGIKNKYVQLTAGGPVQSQAMSVLFHEKTALPVPSHHMNRLADGVYNYIGHNRTVVEEFLATKKGRRARAFLGYAGWSTLQLDAEYIMGSWILCDVSPKSLLRMDPDETLTYVMTKCSNVKKAYSDVAGFIQRRQAFYNATIVTGDDDDDADEKPQSRQSGAGNAGDRRQRTGGKRKSSASKSKSNSMRSDV